jgi:hypothetical protein
MNTEPLCAVCGDPAPFLCDFVLGGHPHQDDPSVCTTDKPLHTCDTPLCEKHRTQTGSVHYKMSGGGMFDSVDMCPIHATATRQSLAPISDDRAAELRRGIMATYRRQNVYVAVADVRYCRECGHIGEIPKRNRSCCPDGNHAVYIHPDLAEQARKGFMTMLQEAKL